MKITQRVEKVGHPEWKWEFPEGFILVVDTREQDRLFKKPPRGLVIVRDKLDAGDYSIKGFESSVAIERKNVMDLFGSLGKERDRFKKEIERLERYERVWLVIEGSEEEVLSFQPYSQLHPNVVRASLASIEVRYHIGVYYARTKGDAERWILDRLLKFFKTKRGNGK